MELGRNAQSDHYAANLMKPAGQDEDLGQQGFWHIRCIRPDGTVRWDETFKNIVVNQGKIRALGQMFSGTAAIGSWYVGLLNDNTTWTPGVHTNTLVEINTFNFTDWAGGTGSLPQWTPLSTVSMNGNIAQIQNTSPIPFTINQNGSVIGGAFLTSQIQSGNDTGELYAYGRWVGDANKNADNGDTLQVTATMTATSP